jgi:hypothetical protein
LWHNLVLHSGGEGKYLVILTPLLTFNIASAIFFVQVNNKRNGKYSSFVTPRFEEVLFELID